MHGRGLNQRVLAQHEKQQLLLPFALRPALQRTLQMGGKAGRKAATDAAQLAVAQAAAVRRRMSRRFQSFAPARSGRQAAGSSGGQGSSVPPPSGSATLPSLACPTPAGGDGDASAPTTPMVDAAEHAGAPASPTTGGDEEQQGDAEQGLAGGAAADGTPAPSGGDRPHPTAPGSPSAAAAGTGGSSMRSTSAGTRWRWRWNALDGSERQADEPGQP